MDTKDFTKDFDKSDISANKRMACLSYIGFLVIIPLIAAKNSKYAKWHAKQGLNLFILDIIFGIIVGVLQTVFKVTKCNYAYCFYVTPWYINILISLVYIFIFVLIVMGVVYACSGKAKELPIVNKIKIVK